MLCFREEKEEEEVMGEECRRSVMHHPPALVRVMGGCGWVSGGEGRRVEWEDL